MTKSAFALAAALGMWMALLSSSAEAAQPSLAKQPNIVVILSDDMGYSDPGCFGSEIETPNLDRLASNGLRFTQFYNTARCCPTRAALLTGWYPHQAGMGHMTGPSGNDPGYRGDLSHDAHTIAEVLGPAGYATYMTGKWHVTNKDTPKRSKDNWPRQRGFDRFYGTIKGGGSYYDPAMLTRDNTPITPLSDPEYQPKTFYYTDAIADQSARFIREHHEQKADKPFFMYVAFTSPHWPLHAPPETIAKYKGKYDAGYEPIRAARFKRMQEMGLIDSKWELSPAPKPWSATEHKEWEARCMEVYAAQIDRMDQGIGHIMSALTEAGQLENTLILFLNDNGACAENTGRDIHEDRNNAPATQPRKPGEIQLEVFPRHTIDGRTVRDGYVTTPGADDSFMAYGRGWANVSNTPFREYKHWVHEGGISTPLIAHWPKGIARHGEMEPQPGHLIDIMATCVELSGADYPGDVNRRAVLPVQGVSLAPAFHGQKLARTAPIFWEHEANRAIRDGKWKLVAKGIAGPWELYDMEADRSEMHDLASANPDRTEKMAAAWTKWAEASQVFPLNDRSPKPPAQKPQ